MESDTQSHDRRKLPKHIMKDGAKWLMLPSKIILASLSVWPENQNKFTLITHIFWLLSYTVSIMGNFFYVTGKEVALDVIARSLSLLTVSIETVSRRLLYFHFRKKLSKVLSKVYFEFFASNVAGKELHEELAKGSRYLFIYCTFYTCSAFLSAWQHVLMPYFSRDLPLWTAYPFAWQECPYYELLYIWQSFMVIEAAFNICGLDLFFVSLLFNCISQFKLLRNFLKINFERDVQNDDDNNTKVKKLIRLCIQRHVKLIRVCNEIDEIFTYFILTQYLASIATVCLSSFVLTVIPDDVGQAITYLMGHICEILIYCYMGNELINESTELSNAVFQCGWHLAHKDKDLQKSLIMIMIRSQKPILISAGGFGFLSLTSFAKLIQFSFSVYTLLNSIMKKQNGIV